MERQTGVPNGLGPGLGSAGRRGRRRRHGNEREAEQDELEKQRQGSDVTQHHRRGGRFRSGQRPRGGGTGLDWGAGCRSPGVAGGTCIGPPGRGSGFPGRDWLVPVSSRNDLITACEGTKSWPPASASVTKRLIPNEALW